MASRRLQIARLTAAGLAAAIAYAALALSGHAPGGWRLRTLVHSEAELDDAERAAHRRQRLETFALESTSPDGVLFIGSSTIEFFDLAAAFPGANVINRGVGDESLAELGQRLDATVARSGCAAWVLYGGSVDLRRLHRSPEAIAGHVAELLNGAEGSAPEARVILLGVLPERGMDPSTGERVHATNRALAALAASRPLVSFVETCRPPITEGPSGTLALGMSADRLHLNDAGYKEVASWILEADEEVGELLRP